ncbi:FAD-binding oxidoreductase [Myxococcota bacterium]|nr:FAD-binding oxidoreductase [Myxococcota bacterium]
MSDIVETLRAELGDAVETDPEVLASHARDTWVLSELDDFEGFPPAGPLAVVTPTSTAGVSTAVAVCREARVPLVTYGGGSGVCGAIRTDASSVVLSTRGLSGAVSIERDDLVASFRAGTLGIEAERSLESEGLTLGHWPQSIDLSTVGGWVATRASGQYSTAYGSIEDMLLDLEAVLPDGRVLRTQRTPRAALGPDLRHLLLGSEGTLGVVTEVGFSVRPRPEHRRTQAYSFRDFEDGIRAIRVLLQAGWRPAVVRFYDAFESKRHFESWCPDQACALIMIHEGPAALVEAQYASSQVIMEASQGDPMDPQSVDHWHETRNRVPGFREFLERGYIVDTIEVSCLWSRVAEFCELAQSAFQRVPGGVLLSAHTSHSYRSGTNLYFTFLAKPERSEDMREAYWQCWRCVLDTALKVEGSIAHHHGVGRVRRNFMAREWGDSGVSLLRSVKKTLDPEGLFNPGALLPDVVGDDFPVRQ